VSPHPRRTDWAMVAYYLSLGLAGTLIALTVYVMALLTFAVLG